MTEKQAENLLEDIDKIMENKISKKEIPEELADFFYDKCVTINVDQFDEEAIVFVGKNAYSVKPSNVVLDLKRLFNEGGEFLLTVTTPEGIMQIIQLVFLVIVKVLKLAILSLGEYECNIVRFLHEEKLYEACISEEALTRSVIQKYEMQEQAVTNAIENLYKAKIIEISEGRINLNEKVHLSI